MRRSVEPIPNAAERDKICLGFVDSAFCSIDTGIKEGSWFRSRYAGNVKCARVIVWFIRTQGIEAVIRGLCPGRQAGLKYTQYGRAIHGG